MQSFLYVLGPFIMKAGLGIAAVIFTIGFLYFKIVPQARLANAKRRALEDDARQTQAYAEAANQLVCDLVVGGYALGPALEERINILNTPIHNYKKELA